MNVDTLSPENLYDKYVKELIAAYRALSVSDKENMFRYNQCRDALHAIGVEPDLVIGEWRFIEEEFDPDFVYYKLCKRRRDVKTNLEPIVSNSAPNGVVFKDMVDAIDEVELLSETHLEWEYGIVVVDNPDYKQLYIWGGNRLDEQIHVEDEIRFIIGAKDDFGSPLSGGGKVFAFDSSSRPPKLYVRTDEVHVVLTSVLYVTRS